MSADGRAVRASSGVVVEPDAGLLPPERFDYLVVVGGTLHRGPVISDATIAWLHARRGGGRAAGRHLHRRLRARARRADARAALLRQLVPPRRSWRPSSPT